ncbi:ferredoxin [Candidatus Gracilibacteria bacterium]|nr:ferredoxin [Candidatus Gracilibacteria bacterium]
MNNDSKKVVVNDACIGCGICATIASEVFEMNSETNKSEVRKDADFSEENLAKAKAGAEACPVGAIKIE